MANSKYEYVKTFERDEILLPNTWIVVRIDGRGFHHLSAHYNFVKPNDESALNLMNAAAAAVVESIPEICIAYGVSDEYSFVFHRSTDLFERRASKLVTTVVSSFTSYYVYLWPSYRPETPLTSPWLPTFDGRAVCYPSMGNLRDYLTWRQVDCHINNLYNTTFWNLVQDGGMSTKEAEEALKGTVSSDKNEILFSRFGINYNNEPDMYKKGSVVFKDYEPLMPSSTSTATATDTLESERSTEQRATVTATSSSSTTTTTTAMATEAETTTDLPPPPPTASQAQKQKRLRVKAKVVVRHVDIIREGFWERRRWILGPR